MLRRVLSASVALFSLTALGALVREELKGDDSIGEPRGRTPLVDIAAEHAKAGCDGELRAVAVVRGTKVQIAKGDRKTFGLEPRDNTTTLEFTRFATALGGVREAWSTRPKDARLLVSPRATLPEEMGSYADLYGAAENAKRACTDGSHEFEVPFRKVLPAIRKEYASAIETSTLVGTYETYFSRKGDQEQRGLNIDAAASKLDGLILPPKRLVSFNDVVGERSEENGFHRSFEIYKGEMVEGIGGGTCQVATTFHAATFFAGLEVAERLPHSRPSVYVPMGLDATVVFPIVDLKVRNPFDVPIVAHVAVIGSKLRVELLSARRFARVVFSREVEENIPYQRKVVEKDTLAATEVVHKQHGIPGYKIKRVRTLRFFDGKSREETLHDAYPPTSDIFEVPPQFDPGALPPLPEGEGTPLDPQQAEPVMTPASAIVPPTVATTEPTTSPTMPAFLTRPGKGAHAPTAAQIHPAKKVVLAQ